jgi:hypothetical protein
MESAGGETSATGEAGGSMGTRFPGAWAESAQVVLRASTMLTISPS